MRAPPGTIALADAMKRASGRGRSDNGAGAAEPLPKLVPIRFVEGEAVQPRGWIVHGGYIPTRTTTLIQGNGGDGKTSLAQQLQSSCATALPWIGLRVEECVSVGFYSEDEEQDIKERQAAIDAAYGQNCVSTGKMYLFSRADEDSELVVFDRARRPSPTKFYWQAREAAMDLRARLVEFDVAVDLFGGDENKRTEVRAFIRPLNTLARQIDGAVVLTSHVSQSGIKSDGAHSGSTDWSNAVRSRLYLSRPKAERDGEPADTNDRLLTRKKANFASTGDTVKLRWQNGLIVPDFPSTPSYFRRSADDVFLALLDAVTKEGQRVSPNSRAGNYAPALFTKRLPRERDEHQRPDFERAMQSLFSRNLIRTDPYGPPSACTQMIVRADAPKKDGKPS